MAVDTDLVSRRSRCINRQVAILERSLVSLQFLPGEVVEYHPNCSLIDAECDYETCIIVRSDLGNGWYLAKFPDETQAIVHADECLKCIASESK